MSTRFCMLYSRDCFMELGISFAEWNNGRSEGASGDRRTSLAVTLRLSQSDASRKRDPSPRKTRFRMTCFNRLKCHGVGYTYQWLISAVPLKLGETVLLRATDELAEKRNFVFVNQLR